MRTARDSGRPAAGRRTPVARRSTPRWRWGLAAAALVILASSFGWYFIRESGPDFDRVANLLAPGEAVVFFGDSITQGYGVREGESFPSLVAQELGVPLVNAGMSGDTTAAGLTRMDRDVFPHRPRLTVVEFGGNDFLRRVPVEETFRNLDAMVSALIAQGTVVVILEVNVGLVGDPYLKGYRAVAERHGAVLVADIMRGILGNPDLKVDSIHPNAQGHRRIAERVAKVLRPLLREADRRRGSQARSSANFPLPEFRPVGYTWAS